MQPHDFTVFQNLLKTTSGLVIDENKGYLLEARLKPILAKYALTDIAGLAGKIRANQNSPEAWEVVEAMTTNETSFFRDTRPFDMFRDHIIPDLMEKKKMGLRKIRIWSAACSSGQEAYSLAMIIKEKGWLNQGWQFEIIGTDISNDILDTAKEGLYTQFEVQRGLPIQMLVKYFTQDNEKWRINDEIKKMIKFSNFNLLKPMSLLGKFDLIFCRNVLIYFDQPTKGVVLDAMHKVIDPKGHLVLGGAETVLGITENFKPVSGQRGLYAPQ